MEITVISKSKEETVKLGSLISKFVRPSTVILLKGDLGAGKTTFVSGLANGLGIKEKVISPTFNIMKTYFSGTMPLFHIDAYRLENQNIELGLDEFIEGNGVCLIEWPVFIESLIPEDHLDIKIENNGGDERKITFSSFGETYERILSSFKEQL